MEAKQPNTNLEMAKTNEATKRVWVILGLTSGRRMACMLPDGDTLKDFEEWFNTSLGSRYFDLPNGNTLILSWAGIEYVETGAVANG